MFVAVDRRVDDGNRAQAVHDRLHDEGQVGELGAGALVLGLLRVAQLRHAREVDLEHRVHVRGRPPAGDHVLGDLAPHDRHRHHFVARQPGTSGAAARVRRLRPRRFVSMKPRMSCLVTRPPAPEPSICAMSTPCSAAIFRTTGDDFCRRSSSADGVVRRAWASGPARPPASVAVGSLPRAVGSGRRRGGRRGSDRVADDGHDVVHGDRLAFLGPDLGQHARGRRRNLGVDLVGRDLEQRLVAIDPVADLLHPSDDGAFGDRLAHLRHQDVGWHVQLRLEASTAARAVAVCGWRPKAAGRVPPAGLDVNRAAVQRVGRLAHRLGERRVRVDRPDQLLARALEAQRHRRPRRSDRSPAAR